MDAPTDDLIRGINPVRAEGDGKTLVGYPIVYNDWTEIHSWEGDFLERIAPGAVDRSINQRGDKIKVQYNHGMHPMIGSSGLGKARTMRADRTGLYVEVPLSDTWYNRDHIIPQLRDGTLDGMSFRFGVVDEDWDEPKRSTSHNPDRLPERTIKEVRLYEFGPVDWPAYEATQVGIRSSAGLSKWLSAPAEERSQLMSKFGIAAEHCRRITVPESDASRDTSDASEDAAEPTDPGISADEQAADPGTLRSSDDIKRRRRQEKFAKLIRLSEITGE